MLAPCMVGPEGHIHRWTAPRKISSSEPKNNASTKSLVERLCDFKIFAFSVLGNIGCISDDATLKDEAHAQQYTTAGPYNAVLTDLLRVGSVCGLGPDMLGIHTLSLAALCRPAANSGTLASGLTKVQAARGYDRSPGYAITYEWKEKILNPSMAHSTMEAYESVCRLDHAGKVAESPAQKRKKKPPRLCSATKSQNSTLPNLQLHASPESLDLSVESALHSFCLRCVMSRASRPGLAVGIPRILCNGLCTAQRFHMEGEEQRCGVRCLDEPGSLSHYNECPLLYNIFASVWRHAAILPRRGHLFHDLVAQMFLRSLQCGITVMGVTDAFVYAHNHHRRNIDDSGNFEDCMKGRIRFMTAITTN